MASLKKKKLSLSEIYKAITEMESGTKPSKVAENMVFLEIQYRHGCYLEIKKKIKSAFHLLFILVRLYKWKTWGSVSMRIWGKLYLDWFKRVRMNNLLISGTILREKAISFAQELQVEKFHASNGWFER